MVVNSLQDLDVVLDLDHLGLELADAAHLSSLLSEFDLQLCYRRILFAHDVHDDFERFGELRLRLVERRGEGGLGWERTWCSWLVKGGR